MPKPTDNSEPRFSIFITEDDTGASHMWSRDCDADTVITQLTRYMSNYLSIMQHTPYAVDAKAMLKTFKQMSECILWVLSFTSDEDYPSKLTGYTIEVARAYGKKHSLSHYTITKLTPEDIIRERLNREAKGS